MAPGEARRVAELLWISALISSSSRPRALLSCMAAIGPRVSIPEDSGALAGPQVCLGLSGSSSVP